MTNKAIARGSVPRAALGWIVNPTAVVAILAASYMMKLRTDSQPPPRSSNLAFAEIAQPRGRTGLVTHVLTRREPPGAGDKRPGYKGSGALGRSPDCDLEPFRRFRKCNSICSQRRRVGVCRRRADGRFLGLDGAGFAARARTRRRARSIARFLAPGLAIGRGRALVRPARRAGHGLGLALPQTGRGPGRPWWRDPRRRLFPRRIAIGGRRFHGAAQPLERHGRETCVSSERTFDGRRRRDRTGPRARRNDARHPR